MNCYNSLAACDRGTTTAQLYYRTSFLAGSPRSR